MITVASWNVNSIRARLAHIVEWLPQHAPDLIALQETKVQDQDFPLDDLRVAGYEALFNGQKTYNGVAVLSRRELSLLADAIPNFADDQRRVLAVDTGDFVLINLYVPNGARVGSEKYDYKLAWLDALREWLAGLLDAGHELLVVGDFNIAPADEDVHDPETWRDKILCSVPERKRLRALIELGLTDLFRRFDQPPASFSWWDYRAGGFRRNHGLRIDLLLASTRLAARATHCTIDNVPRGWIKPSDHAPVLASFAP